MKRKLLSRASKAECLIKAAINLEIKAKAKGIDLTDKKRLQSQAEFMGSEAIRYAYAMLVHGDQVSTRTVKDQAAKE